MNGSMYQQRALGVLVVQLLYLGCLIGVFKCQQVPVNEKQNDEAQLLSRGDYTVSPNSNPTTNNLEARANDRNFIQDIVNRLHALDADIGKLMYNSTSMYVPNDQVVPNDKAGGQKFTEVLNDLDSIQDEIGILVQNATRTRQYNMLVRLRPLNNLIYRIRHNLHLIRNSLVAINTVSRLEKIGNNVLDSTLQAFMKPDANLNDEIGDNGNYDIDLDRYEPTSSTFKPSTITTLAQTTIETLRISTTEIPKRTSSLATSSSSPVSHPSSTPTSSPPQSSTTVSPSVIPSSLSTSSLSSTLVEQTPQPTTNTTAQVSTRRSNQRPQTRRPNNRQNHRRSTTQKPSSTVHI